MEFKEKNHDYIENGIYYTPVSDVIKRFTPDFNSDKISKIVASNSNREQEDVLAEWDLKRDIACDFGNSVHQATELWIRYETKPKNYFLEKLIDKFPLDREQCFSEEIVYNDDLLVAGTIDIPYIASKGSDSSLEKVSALYDVKTNRELKKTHGKLLEPFDDLPNNKLTKYRMQLSIYKMLYEKMHNNAKIDELYILQTETEEDIDWNVIKVEPLDYDMFKIIKDLELKVEKEEKNIIKDLI